MTSSVFKGEILEQWSIDVGGDGTESFNAIQETSDGGFIIVGYVEPPISGADHDVYIVKTDRDRMYKIISTSDGWYITVRFTWSYGSTGMAT